MKRTKWSWTNAKFADIVSLRTVALLALLSLRTIVQRRDTTDKSGN